jgi:adenylate cyclase
MHIQAGIGPAGFDAGALAGLGAEAVVTMMNEYFAFMADVIRGNYGVIDKYIGDAIMALFGVPKSTGNDADNAVRAGFAMLQALDLLKGL